MSIYTITCKAHNHPGRPETNTGTLNELRAWLIEEATRWDWNLEGLHDTADAIYDDEPLPEATIDEVQEIAARVWDEHPRHITISEN